jgi:hypothetical protein
VAAVVLDRRALNRATLARQLLLERSSLGALDAVAHLVGLQAQQPQNPYVALWSRLAGFDPEALGRLLADRQVVRIAIMRSTIHLVTADDCLELRPLMQPVLDGELARHPLHRPNLAGVDLAPVLAYARRLLATPHTGPQLRKALQERFPDLDAAALAHACRNHLALVQVPPRGLWRRSAQVTLATAESWLGRPLATAPSIDGVVLRYLGAFGPATVADVSAWSRLTGMREVVERLRPGLRTFRDEDGRELFDVPDAPRPDPDVPAPPRLLPEYDNVLLSHADRRRFLSEVERAGPFAAPKVQGAALADGRVCATWWIDRHPETGTASLQLDLVRRLPKRGAAALAAEARRLLALLEPGAAAHDVRLVEPG